MTLPSELRCGIFIDLEGTSSLFSENENRYLQALDSLLYSSTVIANHTTDNRLLLHQMGADGLFIISDGPYRDYSKPLAVAIVLMQIVLLAGAVTKCGISFGNNGDYRSALPRLEALLESGYIEPRAGGLMTKVNIMGTALINSHRVASIEPRGGRLAVDSRLSHLIPSNIKVTKLGADMVIVDWIHNEISEIDQLYSIAGIAQPGIEQLENALKAYVKNTGSLGLGEWGENTLQYADCLS